MRLYLDLDLLKGPKAPTPPKAAKAAAPKAAKGSTVSDVGTGAKAGAVAPTAPTANAAKAPKAKAPGAGVTPPATTDAGAAKPAQPKSSKSGAGSTVQMVDCPLGKDRCISVSGGGNGRHRTDKKIYQEHAAMAAKGATGGAGAAPAPAAQNQQAAQTAPGQQSVTDKKRQKISERSKKYNEKTGKKEEFFPEGEAKTPSVKIGDQEVHGAAAASVADVPEGLPQRPQKEVAVDKPADSKAPAGKAKRAKTAPDPEFVQMHGQHLQEYLSGSRDQEHHKVLHAMTVAEHRRASAEFRSAGNNDLAQLHEQAAIAKPRLKDLTGTKAHETVPEGERAFSSHYLESYIGQSSRYLSGSPGAHPNKTHAQIHAMTESEHNNLATKLEAAGANSAAARHRRIAAMKKEFPEREKQMMSRKDAESRASAELKSKKAMEGAAKKEAKRKEGMKVPNNPFSTSSSSEAEAPKSHADELRSTGSNALSHLVHNHDMPPEHKRDLLQQVLKLHDLHDRAEAPAAGDAEELGKLKESLGHYGSNAYTGRKSTPGKRYLSRFEPHELEAHAELAEMSGMGDLASKYRDAASAKHEANNRERVKGAEKAHKEKTKTEAKEAKVKASTEAKEAKAKTVEQARAAKTKERDTAKAAREAASAERKRVSTAPHLPGDHGEYTKHAQGRADRLHDFLNSPADLEPHQRERLEGAHKIISAHAKLGAPATPEQRRELDDALKVSDSHMKNAKFFELGNKPDPVNEQYKINTQGIYSAFSKWWGQSSAVVQSSAKDQTSGQLASQLPHVAANAAVSATQNILSGEGKKQSQAMGNDSPKHGSMKYGEIAGDVNKPAAKGSEETSAKPVAAAPATDDDDHQPVPLTQKKSAPAPASAPKKRPSARAKKSLDMYYIDLSKAVQVPNVGIDGDKEKITGKGGQSGGGSAATPDDPKIGRDWHSDEEEDTKTEKSFLSEMQDLLRSMSTNLSAQLRPGTNSPVEATFLESQGYSPTEAKYNTALLSKGLLRKKYDTWLVSRMEKSLSSLWGKQ